MSFTRKHDSIPVGDLPHDLKPEKFDVPPAEISQQPPVVDTPWRSTYPENNPVQPGGDAPNPQPAPAEEAPAKPVTPPTKTPSPAKPKAKAKTPPPAIETAAEEEDAPVVEKPKVERPDPNQIREGDTVTITGTVLSAMHTQAGIYALQIETEQGVISLTSDKVKKVRE